MCSSDLAANVIAVDTHLTASSRKAHIVLAASAFAEKSGTHTNLEGRVTRLAQQVTPAGVTRPDWMIATDLALELGRDRVGDHHAAGERERRADLACRPRGAPARRLNRCRAQPSGNSRRRVSMSRG